MVDHTGAKFVIVNALSTKFPPVSVTLIVKEVFILDVGVPLITPVEVLRDNPVARDPETIEYVTDDPPSASVAWIVVEYAIFLVKTGREEFVTHTGAFPAVTEFEEILTADPVGWFETEGFTTVIVYGLADGGKLSGRVTINWEELDLTIDLAAVEEYPVPVNETATFEAKFPPVIVTVSFMFAIKDGLIEVINGPAVTSEVVDDVAYVVLKLNPKTSLVVPPIITILLKRCVAVKDLVFV